MTTVVVNAVNDVTIDGAKVGNISDAFNNHRDDAGPIYDAIVAYEESLRQARIDDVAAVQELLNTANATIEQLRTDLSDAQKTYQADVEALQSTFDARSASAQATFNETIASAQATFAACQQRTAVAEKLQQAHCVLTQVLLNQGASDAAVAAMQELTRCQQAKEKAELQAKLAALPE